MRSMSATRGGADGGRIGAEKSDQPAYGGERLDASGLDVGEGSIGGRPGFRTTCVAACLGQHDDAGDVVADDVVELPGEVEALVLASLRDAHPPLVLADVDVDDGSHRRAEEHEHRHREDGSDGPRPGPQRDCSGGDDHQGSNRPAQTFGPDEHRGEEHGHHDELGEEPEPGPAGRRAAAGLEQRDHRGGRGDRQHMPGLDRPRGAKDRDRADGERRLSAPNRVQDPPSSDDPEIHEHRRTHHSHDGDPENQAQRRGNTGEIHAGDANDPCAPRTSADRTMRRAADNRLNGRCRWRGTSPSMQAMDTSFAILRDLGVSDSAPLVVGGADAEPTVDDARRRPA